MLHFTGFNLHKSCKFETEKVVCPFSHIASMARQLVTLSKLIESYCIVMDEIKSYDLDSLSYIDQVRNEKGYVYLF